MSVDRDDPYCGALPQARALLYSPVYTTTYMIPLPFVNIKHLFIHISASLRRFRVSSVGIPASSHPMTL